MKTKEHKESNGCEKYYCWRYALYKINFWTILKKLLQKNDFRRFPLFEIFARMCIWAIFSWLIDFWSIPIESPEDAGPKTSRYPDSNKLSCCMSVVQLWLLISMFYVFFSTFLLETNCLRSPIYTCDAFAFALPANANFATLLFMQIVPWLHCIQKEKMRQ